MRRPVEIVGLAVVIQVIAVWWNDRFQGISLLVDPAENFGVSISLVAMAGLAGVLAWRAFRPTPVGPGVSLVLVALGAFMTFAWPIAFAASAGPWFIDTVAAWGSGAALPEWEGAMTAVIGAGLLLRLVGDPPDAPRDPR